MSTTNVKRPWIPWRLVIIITLSLVLLLEIIFSVFNITGRMVEPFDMLGPLTAISLICARPKAFRLMLHAQFTRLPSVYKAWGVAAVFVIMLKVIYFLSYLAAMLFKGH